MGCARSKSTSVIYEPATCESSLGQINDDCSPFINDVQSSIHIRQQYKRSYLQSPIMKVR